jgi:hypothetical protein
MTIVPRLRNKPNRETDPKPFRRVFSPLNMSKGLFFKEPFS